MTLHLFEGYGIELEYMIVDQATLELRSIADLVLGESGELDRGAAAWSNELVMHVLEFKTHGPAPSLAPLGALFQGEVAHANALLAAHGACLLGTAMHPWMNPATDARLWPHEYTEVYRTFDRIFDCRGHGWSNLQSMHINLPFAGDDEFRRLHAAIRVVLPLLPALAASSPFVGGEFGGILDQRLQFYRLNSRRIPSVTGRVIPERMATEAQYRREILERIWRDTAPHDPEGVLAHEFANARGAIARFDRGAIEIRVLDLQEHPGLDLAVAELAVGLVRALVEERWASWAAQDAIADEPLQSIFLSTMLEAESALVTDPEYLALLGLPGVRRLQAGELWQTLAARLTPLGPHAAFLLSRGTLARRLLRAVGPDVRRERLREVYGQLGRALAAGEGFTG